MHFGCVFIGLIRFTVLYEQFYGKFSGTRIAFLTATTLKTIKFRKVILLFTNAKTKAKRIQGLYKYILFEYNGKRTIIIVKTGKAVRACIYQFLFMSAMYSSPVRSRSPR